MNRQHRAASGNVRDRDRVDARLGADDYAHDGHGRDDGYGLEGRHHHVDAGARVHDRGRGRLDYVRDRDRVNARLGADDYDRDRGDHVGERCILRSADGRAV